MNDMKRREIYLKGYKSIAAGETIFLGRLDNFAWGQGSGKSNLVSFFSMLNYMTTGTRLLKSLRTVVRWIVDRTPS